MLARATQFRRAQGVLTQKRSVWNWLEKAMKAGSGNMEKTIEHLSCEKIETKNFGTVHRATINSRPVFFQPSKIIVGELNDKEDVEECLNLGRKTDGVVLDDNERLDPYVPGEAAAAFRKGYFVNSISDPAAGSGVLSSPVVYGALPKLSPCVIGVTFMNNSDLVAEYEYTDKKALDHDVDLLLKVYEGTKGSSHQEKE